MNSHYNMWLHEYLFEHDEINMFLAHFRTVGWIDKITELMGKQFKLDYKIFVIQATLNIGALLFNVSYLYSVNCVLLSVRALDFR